MLLRNSFQSIVVRDERGLLKIIAWFHAKSFFDLESVNLKLLRHHQQSIPHLGRDHVCCVHNPQTYNWLLGFWDFAQRNIFENDKKNQRFCYIYNRRYIVYRLFLMTLNQKLTAYFSLEFDVLYIIKKYFYTKI